MTTLAGGDAQALHLAAQAVAIGKNRRTFTEADFVRVIIAHLPHGRRLTRETDALRRRAEAAENEVLRLRDTLRQLEDAQRPRRVAYLTRGQAAVFTEACRGKTQEAIAAELGISRTSVSNYVKRAAMAIEADSVPHALSLANRGIVAIRVRPVHRQRRAVAA